MPKQLTASERTILESIGAIMPQNPGGRTKPLNPSPSGIFKLKQIRRLKNKFPKKRFSPSIRTIKE